MAAVALKPSSVLVQRMPPWLRRAVGGALVQGIGDVLDDLMGDAANAVRTRFPRVDSDALALASIGAERRILRGPYEGADTYAPRLAAWLDDHRMRGGPYALARQFFAFWRAALSAPFEIVYSSGRRYSVSALGAITRDDIPWSLPDAWSQFWIFLHVTGLSSTWATDTGATVTTDTGASLVFDVLTGGTLSDDFAASLESVPREWSAAHVQKITIVVLYGSAWCLGYPETITLGDGHVLGDGPPAVLTITS